MNNGSEGTAAKRYIRSLLVFLVLITNISCDQITKTIVRNAVDFHENISVIRNFLTLTKVENTGAFLSLGETLPAPLKIVLLIGLPSLMLMVAALYLFTNKDLPVLKAVSMGFIVGGGIGNIYDRIVHGSVTDFLHIDFLIFETGVFNMADVSIMTGAFLIVMDIFFNRQPTRDLPAMRAPD